MVFPSVLIEVEGNGKWIAEMHVDGGVTAPVLMLPESVLVGEKSTGSPINLYVLIKNKITTDFQVVPGENKYDCRTKRGHVD